MKALVTGAGGFAGRHLVEALAAAGGQVVATGLEPSPPATLAASGVRWASLDVTDAAACRAVLGAEQPERVYHLAGYAHVGRAEREPERCLAVNFGGTRALLESALASAPAARVLLVSSAEVYGRVARQDLPVGEDRPARPATLYGVSKLAAEAAGHHAVARGLHVVIARPFNHVGPGQSPDFVAAAFALQVARAEAGRQDPVLRVGNLEAVRDLSDVRDTVRGYAALLEHGRPGETYNVTSGQAFAVRELLDTLLGLSRVPLRVETDPERLRPVDMPVFHGSGEKALRETGFRASLDLKATLADVLDDARAVVAAGG